MASNAKDAKLVDASTVSVDQLRRELEDSADGGRRSAEVLSEVVGSLSEEPFEFDEETVKQSLDELLLLLVAVGDGDTHGKGLMEDLSTLFGADLSPGTVYPRLHELEEQELLRMHELVRTKEYRLDDSDVARERIEEAMRQHLAMGSFFRAALEDV